MRVVNSLGLSRFDIIKVGIFKYLIYKLNKENVELLPINNLFDNPEPADIIPKISTSYESLIDHEKISNDDLLYLVNQKNPLIKEALMYYLENEKE